MLLPQVNYEGLSAFVAGSLILLDKYPGVRPIGVGEIQREIIAKAILKIIGSDVEEEAGPLLQAKMVAERQQYMLCEAFSKYQRWKPSTRLIAKQTSITSALSVLRWPRLS